MLVLHYIPTLDRNGGGTSFYMQLLAGELGRLVDLHVVTHASEHPVEVRHCTVHHIAPFTRPGEMKKETLTLLRELRPDVVHVNGCWHPACAMVQRWAQKAAGHKVVLTPHGMLEPWIMARHYWTRKLPALLLYQREAVRRADFLHATAESERRNLLALGYNRKVAVIPNGVDIGTIRMKTDWRRRKQILFLSRVHVKKGIEFLIDAVAELRDELAGFRVVVAGEGEANYIVSLNDKAERAGVGTLFDFRGGVYGEEKWMLYRESDVFVLPTYSENFGIAVAEALACGTPVITTKGTPWKELEEHGSGWWTEVGSRPLAETLREFLALDARKLEEMGRRGRRLVEGEYSSRQMAERMYGLYVSL